MTSRVNHWSRWVSTSIGTAKCPIVFFCVHEGHAAAIETPTCEIKLRDFLEGVTHDWAKRLAGKNLRLELEVPDNFPTVHADERRLEEVVHNLLDNAVKYSHQNGRILIQAGAPDQEVVLSVRDEGIGIAAMICRAFSSAFIAPIAPAAENLVVPASAYPS